MGQVMTNTQSNNTKRPFSPETIRRLSLYLRNLKGLKAKNVQIVSSEDIARSLGISSTQVRKDLSYFGGFGKRGVGYSVENLSLEIEHILGMNRPWEIGLVGLGKLGGALLKFPGFSQFNVKITAVFDADPEKIGKTKNGIIIDNINDLSKVLRQKNIKIIMICVPPEYAQQITDMAIKAEARAILNFAPVSLKVPENVYVSNVDMACELETLIYFLNTR
jgi:redox-sensing transcriptional repressor